MILLYIFKKHLSSFVELECSQEDGARLSLYRYLKETDQ